MNNQSVTNTGIEPGVHMPRDAEGGAVIYRDPYQGAAYAARDRIHWGPVWGGLLTALSSFLVMEMFCYWIGLLTMHAGANGVYSAGPTNTWVSAIVGLIAFFLGGWMATGPSSIRSRNVGMLNGFLVWALGIVAILVFSALGSGLIFGTIGDAFGQFFSPMHGAISNGTASLAHDVAVTREASGWGLLFLVLSAIAAAFGGSIGTAGKPDAGTNPW